MNWRLRVRSPLMSKHISPDPIGSYLRLSITSGYRPYNYRSRKLGFTRKFQVLPAMPLMDVYDSRVK